MKRFVAGLSCILLGCLMICASVKMRTRKSDGEADNTAKASVVNEGDWIVTSYVDESGNQGLFYTITDSANETLIVIDGGWTENTDKVRNVIGRLGNHVNAWFVTHYHNDHVGAVNEILEEPEGIEIDRILISPIDMDRYLAESYEWDMPEYYQRFCELTADMDNVFPCDRGEVFKFDGLMVKVLNTYDSYVAEADLKDIPNNGCLVLKFSTANRSMVFMSDAHNNEICDILEETNGDELDCDILQLGHHGNNTIDYSRYSLFSPSEVVFDSPEWLMTGEQYKAAALLEYFQSQDIKSYDYRSGDNTIILN